VADHNYNFYDTLRQALVKTALFIEKKQ